MFTSAPGVSLQRSLVSWTLSQGLMFTGWAGREGGCLRVQDALRFGYEGLDSGFKVWDLGSNNSVLCGYGWLCISSVLLLPYLLLSLLWLLFVAIAVVVVVLQSLLLYAKLLPLDVSFLCIIPRTIIVLIITGAIIFINTLIYTTISGDDEDGRHIHHRLQCHGHSWNHRQPHCHYHARQK